MRTITELYDEGDIVFIKIDNELLAQRFLKNAIEEGFLINGKSKINKSFLKNRIYKLEDNFRIHSISGFISHMSYGSFCKENDGKSVVRIDYARYVNGMNDYQITERKDL